ncbi:hypothetical protein acsn021_24110 [Anaerocolumna cellulosilytica]|uniref:Uncharacterized protein n=1 Tax=Anaerocolumna cellulosilytica TaxID=433286 RepID=A0A6S6R5W9_9FIRM|nr:phosphopantetheine-binding protein [Anaerocolumna cellulosilytica]MBB5193944.1 acyl carrier protein [Anaerocolumna cellulosilytica]BCJ94842.1 hypothetical protein acsn021_24110 [Anaerocolumna cellulosilytica]
MNNNETTDVRDILIQILKSNSEIQYDNVDMNTKLMDLGINSFKSMQVLIELEESLEIQFPDNMLTPEIFETVGSLYQAMYTLCSNEN